MTMPSDDGPLRQANPEHIARLRSGVEEWNRWRSQTPPETPINLAWAKLQNIDLRGVNLSGAHLRCAQLNGSDLTVANLAGANLDGADLDGVNLTDADLSEASVNQADVQDTIFDRTNLMGANFNDSRMTNIRIRRVVTDDNFRWQHSKRITAKTRASSSEPSTAFSIRSSCTHIRRFLEVYYTERRAQFHANNRVYAPLDWHFSGHWTALINPHCRITIIPKDWSWHVAARLPAISFPMSLTHENAGTRFKKVVMGEDVLTGDAPFDYRVHLKGSAHDLIARLDAHTRRTIIDLLDVGTQIQDGLFVIENIRARERSTFMDEMNSLLGALIHVCNALGSPISTESLLRKQARDDGLTDVRVNAAYQWVVTQGFDALPSGVEEPIIESALARALSGENIENCLSIMNHLVHIGTDRSLAPLLDIAHGFMVDKRLKKQAKTTVESIMARVGGQAGGLSLSTVQKQTGGLTLTPDDEAQ